MVISMRSLLGHRVRCSDGYVARISDLHLYNGDWRAQQVVLSVPTQPWRKTVVKTEKFTAIDWTKQNFAIACTRGDVERADCIEDNPPIDWIAEQNALNFNVCATHWSPWSAFPQDVVPNVSDKGPQLYSLRHLLRYSVQGRDGQFIGKVFDFCMEPKGWGVSSITVRVAESGSIKCIALDIGNVSSVDFERRVIALNLNKEAVVKAESFTTFHESGVRAFASRVCARLTG